MARKRGPGIGAAALPALALAVLALAGLAVYFGLVRSGDGGYGARTLTADTLDRYCTDCHNPIDRAGDLALETAALDDIAGHAEVWEKVTHKLTAGSMPPAGEARPEPAEYTRMIAFLESGLDAAAARAPDPGELPQLHRLTRTEYRNAIRDLLALEDLPAEMDYELLLPADNASSGFDNIADLLFVSPVIMERYLGAAQKIARLAVGDPAMPTMVNMHRLPLELPQDESFADLPFGTRGGLATASYFPLDAEYVFHVELAGFPREAHDIEIAIDGERVAGEQIGGGGRRGGLEFRVPVSAGPHTVGVTFVRRTHALDESIVRVQRRSRGSLPAIELVTISGPFAPTGPGETPSRERIFVCAPESPAAEPACAREILATLARRAYRRDVDDTDLEPLLAFYADGHAERGFDAGIQRALERLLVSPQFLYRIERIPADVPPGAAFDITPVELASRLSFFLWSSLPDDRLLDLATSGQLVEDGVLSSEVERMLADPRSAALVDNFAAQWLFLRDVAGKDPDLFIFRDFDEGLREAFVRETELFVESVIREDRSVLDLVRADYSFLNERLAEHYGIPYIKGSRFRRVEFPADSPRGGLLGQGSILTLTSYPTRTSPVLRGKYVLDNLLATPPPPPPPDVPALDAETAGERHTTTLREAMARHRANPECASCHAQMDPIGFAFENFDAVGRWRDTEGGLPIETRSELPDGTIVDGMDGVRDLLLDDPERFVTAVTEKLLMYALGRNIQYYDKPAIRRIVRAAAADDYTFESLITGVVGSVPFRMRKAPADNEVANNEIEDSEGRGLMVITGKHLARRTFLRGIGASIALPALDSMLPALAADTAPATPRLSFIYVGNGIVHENWVPKTTGTGFELPLNLAPLASVRDQLNVISGLAHLEADTKGDGTGDHPRSSAAWLTGVHAYDRTRPGVEVKLATSADQIAAGVIGRDTPLPSIELSIDAPMQGSCDSGDCFYVNTVSWRNETTPNVAELHPRVVFERLFGDGGSSAERRARARITGSILDSVMAEARALAGTLGAGDTRKLDEYLDAVREIERRIQSAESGNAQEIALPERPTSIPDTFEEHARIMFDLQVLAFRADMTRITSMIVARELSGLSYPNIGVPDAHHNVSHHRDDPELIDKKTRIDTYHVQLLAEFAGKLAATPDGDGSLLDQSLILYGSGMGDGNLHRHENLPCLTLGSLGGRIRTGQHLAYPEHTPMTNLLLTLLDRVGVEVDAIGDSTGRIAPDLISA